MSYLNILELTSHRRKVTKEWLVQASEGGANLGVIRWFPPWRRYCFFPCGPCVFEQVCLRELADFIERETLERKEERGGR